MADTPTVADLVAHVARITGNQQKLRDAMAQVAAEHGRPAPPPPPAAQAP